MMPYLGYLATGTDLAAAVADLALGRERRVTSRTAETRRRRSASSSPTTT